MKRTLLVFVALLACTAFSFGQNNAPEGLQVDATDAPRNIIHATMNVPASPGPLTLVYPKWLPGNHRPTGPIQNLTGVHFKAGGKELEWQRDLVDMYAFHLQVPAGASEVEASLDVITYNGKNSLASSKVVDLLWNQVVLYPEGKKSDDYRVTASVKLPEGWKFGTALTPARQSGNTTEFQTVSLTTLVDSPLIGGAFYKQVQLSAPGDTLNVLDIVGESEESIQITDKEMSSLKQLVAEAEKLFGTHHFSKYHFLLTVGDQTVHRGLEHHESSDNGVYEDYFTNPEDHNLEADLLPHEFVHSWNGKYRRPEGLATPNYQDPMKGDLLWVYEGMTDYWGAILAARTGLRSAVEFRDDLAYTAAMLDHRAGRTWRPLQDTATSVQTLVGTSTPWTAWRRSSDYYQESYLIWLEVETMIRKQTGGKKSLNDFCRAFYGGPSGRPSVVTYKFQDVVAALDQVAPYDWASLLRSRLDSKSPHAPMGGIENGGWKLVYTPEKNLTMKASEDESKSLDLRFTLGLVASKEGELLDVVPGTPAYAAGLGPGMKVYAINGRKWDRDTVRSALRDSTTHSSPLTVIAENGEYFNTYNIDYHGGDVYPHLVRVDGQPDLLTEIAKPIAGQ